MLSFCCFQFCFFVKMWCFCCCLLRFPLLFLLSDVLNCCIFTALPDFCCSRVCFGLIREENRVFGRVCLVSHSSIRATHSLTHDSPPTIELRSIAGSSAPRSPSGLSKLSCSSIVSHDQATLDCGEDSLPRNPLVETERAGFASSVSPRPSYARWDLVCDGAASQLCGTVSCSVVRSSFLRSYSFTRDCPLFCFARFRWPPWSLSFLVPRNSRDHYGQRNRATHVQQSCWLCFAKHGSFGSGRIRFAHGGYYFPNSQLWPFESRNQVESKKLIWRIESFRNIRFFQKTWKTVKKIKILLKSEMLMISFQNIINL